MMNDNSITENPVAVDISVTDEMLMQALKKNHKKNRNARDGLIILKRFKVRYKKNRNARDGLIIIELNLRTNQNSWLNQKFQEKYILSNNQNINNNYDNLKEKLNSNKYNIQIESSIEDTKKKENLSNKYNNSNTVRNKNFSNKYT